MISKLKKQLLAALVVTGTHITTALAASQLQQGANSARPTDTPGNLVAVFDNITNTVIFLVGALAVIALVYGGFLYVTSAGDAGRVKTAKDTIIYAVIGIVVAILAYAIVNFVVGALG